MTDFKRLFYTYQLQDDEIWLHPEHVDIVRYVFQEELAPSTGKHHIQGFTRFKRTKTLKQIKAMFGPNIHAEKAYSTDLACYNYCTKEETRFESMNYGQFGDWSVAPISQGQGKRTDLHIVAEEMKSKKPLDQIIQDHPTVAMKYYNNLVKVNQSINPVKSRMTHWDELDIRWYCGPTGLQKTTSVFEEFSIDQIYVKNAKNKWWSNYNQQSVVLIDDYRDNKELSYEDLLKLFSPWSYNAEIKCGDVEITSTTFIVTSNLWPWQIWPSVESDPSVRLTPMTRRCNLFEFTADFENREIVMKELKSVESRTQTMNWKIRKEKEQ